MNPGTHIAAQEKWGGERRETAEGKGGGRGEQSRKAAAFVRGNDSFTRSLAHSFVEVVPPFILPSPTPIEPNDASFPRLRQTDRPNERNHEYTQGDHPSSSFGSKPHS